jgi:hypothetical protein|tara:strand:- start:260 stop:463 length:204 start_codon:yes stop_codon:yes gene_type:complete
MSIRLPNSPVRKIQECLKCGTISVKFWKQQYDRSYTKEEWATILAEGHAVLRKIMKPVQEDPKFFID